MAELIAAGTTQVDSADFTLTATDETCLMLKDAAGEVVSPYATAEIQRKSGTQYFTIGYLLGQKPTEVCKVLKGAGTYRVRKLAGSDFGVDRD